MAPIWDHELPSLALNNVSVHAGSLTEAWKSLSTQYLLRSVLVVANEVSESRPFDYESVACTARDLYDAFANRYGLTWTQDERTGISWLHPLNLPYDHLLTARVHVAQGHLGLPMQSGILETLGTSRAAGITVKQWGSLFLNTFDYAVDVPTGVHTVRDLLNLCCVANPTKTFLARTNRDGVFVTAVNLVSDQAGSVPAGALRWWDLGIAQGRVQRAPTSEQVIAALADRKAEVRCAARNYLEAIIWSAPVDEWAARSVPTAQALWMCIGISSVLVRSEQATHWASIETMQQRGTNSFLAECEPGLAVMTSLELARLARNTRGLEVVTKRSVAAEEVAEVASDACRVAAVSPFVREALQISTAGVLLKLLPPLAEAVRSPTPWKLECNFVS